MFQKSIFAGLLVLTFILAPSAYAGKVEYPTLYPSPNGEYTNVYSTNDSWFATTSGNVGIGATSASYKLEVKGNIVNSIPSQGYLGLTGDLSGYAVNTYPTLKTSGQYIYFDANATYTGYIGYNTGWVDVSDETLKTNITTVNNALEKLSQIRGVTFDWKDGRDHERHMGVVAQDVEKVAPELVSQPQGTNMKGVFYGGLNALTIEAIKEQQKEFKERQRQIELLKKEITELKMR